MEGELWPGLYRLIREEASKRPRAARVQFSDACILEVYLWSVIHDRPVSWACNPENWPPQHLRERELPSCATMSVRLRTLSLLLLMQSVQDRLRELPAALALVRQLDSKPLVVGGYSKDRDAAWGQATAASQSRGYKLFCGWGAAVVPDAWTLGPMNYSDPEAGVELVPKLQGCAYVLGDANHDSNPLHAACASCGIQLVAPRKKPGTGLGHRTHEAGRLRSIEMLECPTLLGTGPSPFGKDLYALRSHIERRYGNLCGTPGEGWGEGFLNQRSAFSSDARAANPHPTLSRRTGRGNRPAARFII